MDYRKLLLSMELLKYSKIAFDNPFSHETRRKTRRIHNGFTKNHSKGESKARRKMAAQSRRINRGKK